MRTLQAETQHTKIYTDFLKVIEFCSFPIQQIHFCEFTNFQKLGQIELFLNFIKYAAMLK